MTAIAATTNGLRPGSAVGVSVDEAASEKRVQRLGRGQTAAVVLSAGLGVMVAGYGLAGSYMSLSELADRHDVPLAWLVPAGIDGGLVAVVVLDLVLTWIGSPVGWLRQLVRVLSVGTVAANSMAGWPDPAAVGLRCAAPVMVLAMLEAGRSVLLHRVGETRGTRREPIPLLRWLLAPWRTLLLWRRMALWQVTGYRTAIDTELQVRSAITLLRVRYGRRWRRRAPSELVWMLRTGVHAADACKQVRALLSIEDYAEPAETISSGSYRGVTHTEVGTSKLPLVDAPASDSTCVRTDDPPLHVDEADARLREALQLNRRHWKETGRPVSAETLRQRLHISASASREPFEQQTAPQYSVIAHEPDPYPARTNGLC